MKKDRLGKVIHEGQHVLLVEAPDSLLNGLPIEDQQAVLAMVGKTALLVGFDAYGNVELEFSDAQDVLHTIWVAGTCIEAIEND